MELLQPGCEQKGKTARFRRMDWRRVGSVQPSETDLDCCGHCLLLGILSVRLLSRFRNGVVGCPVHHVLILTSHPAPDVVSDAAESPYRNLWCLTFLLVAMNSMLLYNVCGERRNPGQSVVSVECPDGFRVEGSASTSFFLKVACLLWTHVLPIIKFDLSIPCLVAHLALYEEEKVMGVSRLTTLMYLHIW